MCNGRTSAAEGPLSDNDLSSFQAEGQYLGYLFFNLPFLLFDLSKSGTMDVECNG